MKMFLKKISLVLFAVIIITMSVMPAFAADTLKLNGVEVKKGDVVSYDLKLGDCEEGVVGFQMYIRFDKECLDIVNNSLEFADSRIVENYNSDYGIIFNFTDYSNPMDFSAEKVLASVDFKVLKGGESDITFFVSELYGKDMTYLKSYTFTYDLAVNEEVKIQGEAPVINQEKEFINDVQGEFVNYVDGKGEKNGGSSAERETVVGSTEAPETFEVGQEVTKDTEKSGSFDMSTVLVVAVVVLLVLVIIVLVILKKALSRKPEIPDSTEVENTDKKEN